MSVKALYLKNYCVTPISASASCTYEGLNCLSLILASCVLVITFSGYAIFRLCLSQVIAFSGYCIFRLEHFPVMPTSGSAKKQGYLIFRYAIFSHPVLPRGAPSADLDLRAQAAMTSRKLVKQLPTREVQKMANFKGARVGLYDIFWMK
jgi:hypothetical protein